MPHPALLAALLLSAAFAAGDLQLQDLSGAAVDPFRDTGVRVRVFLFTRTDCPISNRYAPEVQRLAREFAKDGFRFWLVYLDPGEPGEQIARHSEEFGYQQPALRDPEHRLVRLTGAEVTPEAAVFLGEKLIYRGRIDDRYVAFGQARPEPTVRDLQEVLGALAAGQVPQPRTTRAVGCYISDLR